MSFTNPNLTANPADHSLFGDTSLAHFRNLSLQPNRGIPLNLDR
jgi:hypothetical protein